MRKLAFHTSSYPSMTDIFICDMNRNNMVISLFDMVYKKYT